MATSFPTAKDILTNPTAGSPRNSPDHAAQHANANDAIEALQNKVGIDESADENSLDYKIGKLEEEIAEAGILPTQSGQSGKYLKTNGTSASWIDISSESFITDITDESIRDLSDVGIDSPTDGQILKYNDNNGKWENEDESGGGGGGASDWGDLGGTLSDQEDLQSALDGKVDENSVITGATKTKITYDAKGLVTAGADATQDDIGDGTTYKQYSGTEKTKLSGIEALADVTDATNVAAAGAVMEADTSTASMSFVVDEDNFASNSATKLATQQSTKAYVDNTLAAIEDSVFVWQGLWVTATAYEVNDCVSHDGSSYICEEAHTSGTFATDLAAEKWTVLAEKGEDGSAGGSPDWGDIGGTLSDQTDLQGALDDKQDELTGLTATVSELNILDGVTATASELNALDGITSTVTELNYTDGVTSAIQTQLDAKLATATAASTYQPLDPDLTTIAGLTATTNNFLVSVSSAWASRTPAQVKATLDLEAGTDFYSIAATDSAIDTDVSTHAAVTATHGATGAVVGTTNSQTLTNKTLTSPKINENVAVTATATELNYVDGVTSAIQTQLDAKVDVSGDTMSGALVAADHGTATSPQVVNVVYGTSATPPDASTVPEGTLYIQYEA